MVLHGDFPTQRTPHRKWGRYTFRDVVMLRNAIHLAGGTEALKLGRRLRVRQLSRVLAVLRVQLGASDPLTEIRLERSGASILAHISHATLDPMRAQYVFPEIMKGVKAYLKVPPHRGQPKSLREIKEQQRDVTPRRVSIRHSIGIPLQTEFQISNPGASVARKRVGR